MEVYSRFCFKRLCALCRITTTPLFMGINVRSILHSLLTPVVLQLFSPLRVYFQNFYHLERQCWIFFALIITWLLKVTFHHKNMSSVLHKLLWFFSVKRNIPLMPILQSDFICWFLKIFKMTLIFLQNKKFSLVGWLRYIQARVAVLKWALGMFA